LEIKETDRKSIKLKNLQFRISVRRIVIKLTSCQDNNADRALFTLTGKLLRGLCVACNLFLSVPEFIKFDMELTQK
jgi:hypothetical protein